MSKKYEENVYKWLKRKGLAPKYEHAGIYCIKIDRHIVYIGKSLNMLVRVAQHYVGIKEARKLKYSLLANARQAGHKINFDVLYYATQTYPPALEQELGEKEGELIRQYRPALNTQIPKAEDWTKYEYHKIDVEKIVEVFCDTNRAGGE